MSFTRLSLALIEDDELDAAVIRRQLKESVSVMATVACYTTYAEASRAMKQTSVDCAILDLGLPDLTGERLMRAITHDFPDLPVVVVTGRDDEEFAAHVVKYGIQDYLVKGQFDVVALCHVIRFAMERHKLLQEMRDLNRRLQESLEHIEHLHGLLPICAGCKKIRNDSNEWEEVEVYISERTDVMFSHGMCPVCFAKYTEEINAMPDQRAHPT